MDAFFKYLTPGEDDVNWGLYLNVAGKAIITPGIIYPSPSHPSGYHFTWDKGRILHEYQIVYVTEGNGTYEDASGVYPIKSGSLLIIQPGMWHRYKPDNSTGWTENYVGFNGLMAKHIFSNSQLTALKPVVYIGNREEFIDTYYKIYGFVKEEKPGFQQVSAGMVMKLLGYLISIDKQLSFAETRIEKIIQKACFLIRENVEKEIDFKQYAENNNIAYSYFRRMFKIYTGLPPAKYQLDLKIIRSKELLLSTDKIIKEICYEVGFESIYYFSRLFKNKIGISPSRFRTAAHNHPGRKKS
ncbi:MAG: AraC family transcriptional regulator [Bacteroidales bacterium]